MKPRVTPKQALCRCASCVSEYASIICFSLFRETDGVCVCVCVCVLIDHRYSRAGFPILAQAEDDDVLPDPSLVDDE